MHGFYNYFSKEECLNLCLRKWNLLCVAPETPPKLQTNRTRKRFETSSACTEKSSPLKNSRKKEESSTKSRNTRKTKNRLIFALSRLLRISYTLPKKRKNKFHFFSMKKKNKTSRANGQFFSSPSQ